jgi:hypothetical protein
LNSILRISVKALGVVALFGAFVPFGQLRAQEPDPIGALLEKAEKPTEPLATVTASEAMPTAEPTPAPSVGPPPPETPPMAESAPLPKPPEREPLPPVIAPTPPPPPVEVPPSVDPEVAYQSRLRSAFLAAQGSQGLLDGRWVIRSGSRQILVLQLVDKGRGTLEGAWSDPNRPGVLGASGFIDLIERNGDQLTVTLRPRSGVGPANLVLQLSPDGRGSGEMNDAQGRRGVVMTRQ